MLEFNLETWILNFSESDFVFLIAMYFLNLNFCEKIISKIRLLFICSSHPQGGGGGGHGYAQASAQASASAQSSSYY